MRKTLKKVGKVAVGGVVEYWGLAAFFAVVAFVSTGINSLLAYESNLSFYQVGLVLVATFVGISVGALLIIVVWQRFRQTQRVNQGAAEDDAATKQELTQSGIVFAPNITQNVGLERAEEKPKKANEGVKGKSRPQLEYVDYRVIQRPLDTRNNSLVEDEEDYEDRYAINVNVVLARFYFKPDMGTYDWVDVKAHIFYSDLDNNLLKRVYNPVWFKEESSTKTFERAHAHELIIVLAGTKVCTYECNHKSGGRPFLADEFHPDINDLEGKNFRLAVQLIADRDNEVRAKESFDFSFTLEPKPALELMKSGGALLSQPISKENAAKREYIIKRLQELISQHDQLPSGWISLDDPMIGKWNTFNKGAERFLEQYFDEAHVKRFKKEGVDLLEELLLGYLK